MHTLRKKNMAMPERRIARKCKCDISKYDKYLHEEDNGILYLGHNLKGDYTIIIIAHRLSTIVNCDKIFILEEGKISDSGTHKKLFESNKYYKQLCKTELFDK